MTYEIIRPEDIGLPKTELVLGKHSGRHAFKARLSELCYELVPEEVETAFLKFKQLSDQKKYIFDEDIEALVSEEVSKIYEFYRLIDMSTSGGMNQKPVATVKLKVGD